MELERKEANGREVSVILNMALLDGNLRHGGDALKKRLQSIPHGWRNYRLASSIIDKLVVQIYETMTGKQLQSLQRTIKTSESVIRPKQISKGPGWLTITDEDAERLVNTAMANECAICLKSGADIKKCKLRRSLLNVAPPDDLLTHGCAYQQIAVDCPTPGLYIGIDYAAEGTSDIQGETWTLGGKVVDGS
ncbi:hypothetical protein LJC74_01090 [Eubacteriales bacterium OttesenSCG-928-A19]|nr:hypothetical protein [Eubacteriales bacterium OttesenSCG-928-A19]